MELYEKLKTARISRKITQKTLAQRLGVSRATLSAWESGKAVPAILYLREYQRIFGFEKGYFDEKKETVSTSDCVSFDVSRLNALGVLSLREFYHSLLKEKEYLKNP